MGVLGWPPPVVRAAALDELADARRAWQERQGPAQPPPVSAAFLRDMMRRFPDTLSHPT